MRARSVGGLEEEGGGVHRLKRGMGSVAQRVRHSGYLKRVCHTLPVSREARHPLWLTGAHAHTRSRVPGHCGEPARAPAYSTNFTTSSSGLPARAAMA